MKSIDAVPDLLMPISDASVCGEDLSFSPEFDRIQEARREDDPDADYGEWATELKQADWAQVAATCTALLQTRAKDLRLAGWLAEALSKTRGFSGLAQGLEICAALLNAFGAELHPSARAGALDAELDAEDGDSATGASCGTPEAAMRRDDHERRIGSLSWMAMRLAQIAGEIPITDAGEERFCLDDFEAARQSPSRQGDAAAATGGKNDIPDAERCRLAASRTAPELLAAISAAIVRAQAALSELSMASDRLFSMEGPAYHGLQARLDAVGERVNQMRAENGSSAELHGTPAPEATSGATGLRNAQAAAAFATCTTAIASRAQAMAVLRQAARFFRETEPHSPVSYLLDKAERWGAMPLDAWLRSVVKDEGTLAHLEELLGLAMHSRSNES